MTLFRLVLRILLRSRGRRRRQLDLAVIDKERALTAKALAEARTSRLESFRKTAASFGFGYGLLVVFCYCFFDLKFFPSGLSTGDVLFFLFAALGLGLISLFCTGLGTTLFLPAVFFDGCLPPLRADSRRTPERKFGTTLWIASPTVVVLVAWAVAVWPWAWAVQIWPSLRSSVTEPWWPLLVGGLVVTCPFAATVNAGLKLNKAHGGKLNWGDALSEFVGYVLLALFMCWVFISMGVPGWFLLALIVVAGSAGALGISLLNMPVPISHTSTQIEREKRARQLMTAQILFAFALIPAVVSSTVRLALFTHLGVRTEDTAVSLDKTNLALLQSAADTAGITLSTCRGEDGNAIVAPINVLWHATGARSLVQLRGTTGIDLELNSGGLRLLRGRVERCVEIKEALLFASHSATSVIDEKNAQDALNKEIAPLLKEIGNEWKIKSVKVIGHADPMPLPGDGNYKLAKDRAEAVKILLMKIPRLNNASDDTPKLEASSAGSRHPIKQCDTKAPATYQRECNEVNRRVEVRFRLEPKHMEAAGKQIPDDTKTAPAA